MLKRRVIPVLLLREGRMVKGQQFTNFRDTGNPKTAVRIYSAQDADELVFLDIQGSLKSQTALLDVIHEASTECFMPLAAGGGIKSLDDIRKLLLAGADKVVITTTAFLKPDLIAQAAQKFGTQCIVAGIDYRKSGSEASVWIRCGTHKTKFEPITYAQQLVDLGAGEILLTSIDCDGMMNGYDLDMAYQVVQSVSVPVIVNGGAGNFMHLAEAFTKTDISATACSSLFHFGDNNPIRARSYLRNLNIPMRVLK